MKKVVCGFFPAEIMETWKRKFKILLIIDWTRAHLVLTFQSRSLLIPIAGEIMTNDIRVTDNGVIDQIDNEHTIVAVSLLSRKFEKCHVKINQKFMKYRLILSTSIAP